MIVGTRNITYFLFLITFGLIFPLLTHASTSTYVINSYAVTGIIHQDGHMTIHETIDVSFLQPQRGIIRTIPLTYNVGGTRFKIYIHDVEAKGGPHTHASDSTTYTIKIGDPNVFFTGQKRYVITYTVYGLIKKFSGYQELYRNPIGRERTTSIKKSHVSIIFPASYPQPTNETARLIIGNQRISFPFSPTKETSITSTPTALTISHNAELQQKQGITIALKLPSGYLALDDKMQQSLLLKASDIQTFFVTTTRKRNVHSLLRTLFMVGYVGIFWYGMHKRYKQKARQPRNYIIQYTPPKGLDASEVGVIIDDTIHPHDITALIYQRAAAKYIRIEAKQEGGLLRTKKTRYFLTKLQDLPPDAKPYQKAFFDSLFEKGNTFDLSNAKLFTDHVKKAIENLHEYIQTKGWYTTKNILTKPTFMLMTIVRIVIAEVVFWIANTTAVSIIGGIGLPITTYALYVRCAGHVAILATFRPKTKEIHTKAGQELYDYCRGYRDFLQKVDERQLKTFLQQDPLYVDKTLPFAIVFGLESAFIKKITPVLEQMATGESTPFQESLLFAVGSTKLLDAIRAINTASAYTPPYTSERGFERGSAFDSDFSGGGGGGGGGGSSW